ncbi:MAG: hypothetical protein ACYS4W_07155 [Planctomycetota bacterium]|jgi:hypothetical protein
MMAKKRKTIAIVVALSGSILLVASVIWRKPIIIKYHRHRINALLNEKPELDPGSGLSFFGHEWIEEFEERRDKLVELGYLQRKEFPLSSIKIPSLRFRRLWEELGARFPDNPHTEAAGYEPHTPASIVVWDEQDNLPEWERIISAHDAPPTDIVDESQGRHHDLLAFVGRWGDEEGQVCYIITEDKGGNVKIEAPRNEVGRTELRNIRFDGNRIVLDQFNYMDPNEAYKSPVDMSGEHPFSGVRCHAVLEVNSKNPNELSESVSSIHFTDPNKGILERLK